MPDAKQVDIEQILRDREEKRKAATQGKWDAYRSSVSGQGRTILLTGTYEGAPPPDSRLRAENAQHVVTEHNTGEQVDAALREGD